MSDQVSYGFSNSRSTERETHEDGKHAVTPSPVGQDSLCDLGRDEGVDDEGSGEQGAVAWNASKRPSPYALNGLPVQPTWTVHAT
jgi:hypothetical protein